MKHIYFHFHIFKLNNLSCTFSCIRWRRSETHRDRQSRNWVITAFMFIYFSFPPVGLSLCPRLCPVSVLSAEDWGSGIWFKAIWGPGVSPAGARKQSGGGEGDNQPTAAPREGRVPALHSQEEGKDNSNCCYSMYWFGNKIDQHSDCNNCDYYNCWNLLNHVYNYILGENGCPWDSSQSARCAGSSGLWEDG